MSYGITVINKYGSVIINETSQKYQATSTTYGTASPGSTYPPTGTSLNDDFLIFGAPAVSQSKIVGVNSSGSLVWNNSASAPTSYRWIAFKRSDLFTAGSGYGLQVFDSGGDLCYDSTVGANFRIVEVFSLGGRVPALSFPSQTTNFSNFQNYFILMNPLPTNGPPYFNNYQATWTWASSTTGRITLNGGNLLASAGMIIEVLK